jgi:hypothetical protein
MGKVAYRCRECHRRFYVTIDVDKRLKKIHEWQKKTAEHTSSAKRPTPQTEIDPLDGYEEDFEG